MSRLTALLVLGLAAVLSSGCLTNRLTDKIAAKGDPLLEFSPIKSAFTGRCVEETSNRVRTEFPDALRGENRVLVVGLDKSVGPGTGNDWNVTFSELSTASPPKPSDEPAVLLRREPRMHDVSKAVSPMSFDAPGGKTVGDFAPHYYFLYEPGGSLIDRVFAEEDGLHLFFDAGRGTSPISDDRSLARTAFALNSVERPGSAARGFQRLGYVLTVPLDIVTFPLQLASGFGSGL